MWNLRVKRRQWRAAEKSGAEYHQFNKVEFYCGRKLFIEWQDVDCFMLKYYCQTIFLRISNSISIIHCDTVTLIGDAVVNQS